MRASISTFFFLRGVETVAGFATRLGKADDAARYSALAAATRAAFSSRLFNASIGLYEDGLPVSQILALELGLAPAGVGEALVAQLESGVGGRIARGFRPAGGIVFMRYAFDVLARLGRNDAAIQTLLAMGYPSVDAWVEMAPQGPGGGGATTLWERWEETNEETFGSKNHISA